MSATPNTPPAAAPQSVVWTDASRQALFETWFASIQSTHQLAASTLRLASADASFRRYLRVDSHAAGSPTSRIIMDAPPDKGECKPFVQVAELMAQAGLTVPQVLAWDEPTAEALAALGVPVLATAKSKDEFGVAALARELAKQK